MYRGFGGFRAPPTRVRFLGTLQVTPYNLWSVRAVRWATVGLAALGLLWWALLLVSAAFVTPPALHARGSAFPAFGYAGLALANLLAALAFFAVPSRAARALGFVAALLLAADAVLLLAVAKTRREEGWVGLVSVLCKFLVPI